MLLLYVLIILAIFYVGGFLFLKACSFELEGDFRIVYLFVGYVVFQLLFLLGIYFIGAYYSFYFLMTIFVISATLSVKKIKLDIAGVGKKKFIYLFFLVLLIAYMPLFQSSGLYWHTASEDAFDALNGKDFILGAVQNLQDFLPNTDAIKNYIELRGESLSGSFLFSKEAIQYTSIAFFSILTGFQSSFDPWLIHANINLIMMFCGIYLLATKVFIFGRIASLGVAFFSTLSGLYFGTYINMHQGSLMFGAVMPFVLYALFIFRDTTQKAYLFLALGGIVFIGMTYVHPLFFFLIPFIFFALSDYFKKAFFMILSKKYYALFLFFALTLASFWIYGIVEHYIAFRESRFRSWGISFEPQMLLIYWGLAQSNITNGVTVNAYIFANKALMNVLYFIVVLYSLVTVYGFIKLSKRFSYFYWFVAFWIVWFVGIRFVIGDSYYFYKLLYTTQFVFLLFFVYGLKSLYETRRKSLRFFAVLLAIVFAVTNLFFNTLSNYIVSEIDANKIPQKYSSILDVDENILKSSYIDVPKQYQRQILDYYMRSKGVFYIKNINDAECIVLLKDGGDIHQSVYEDVSPVFENAYLKVIKKPDINYLSHYGQWESELSKEPYGNFKGSYFQWFSNGNILSISGKSDKHYIRFCVESGTSIDYKNFELNVSGNAVPISGDGCFYKRIPPFDSFSLRLSSDVKGKKLLPFDDRELNYRIGYVGFTDEMYDSEVLMFLNPSQDVLPEEVYARLKDGYMSNDVVLGNGWYPQEAPNMRWGSDGLELLVLNTTKDNLDIEFDIEPGPTLKELPLRVEILNSEDQKIGYFESQSKGKVVVNIPVKSNERYQILKLKVLNETGNIPQDPRMLNLRLFAIKAAES